MSSRDRERRLPLHGEGGQAEGRGGGEERHQALRGANFRCLMSGTPIAGEYIKAEGKAGRMGARLMAIVAEGDRGRVYLAPTPEMEAVALSAKPRGSQMSTIFRAGTRFPGAALRPDEVAATSSPLASSWR